MNWIFVIAFLFCPQQEEVPIKDKEAFTKKFDEVSESTSSIMTRFVQKKYVSFSKEPLQSEGMLYFQEHKMRWEQTTPKDYIMVINDEVMFTKEDGKIEEQSLSSNKIMKGMKEILMGSMTGNLLKSDHFETSIFETSENFIVKLVPKARRLKKMFSLVKMTFNRETYRMDNVVLTESKGDYTVITFENPEFNKKLDEKLFSIE